MNRLHAHIHTQYTHKQTQTYTQRHQLSLKQI